MSCIDLTLPAHDRSTAAMMACLFTALTRGPPAALPPSSHTLHSSTLDDTLSIRLNLAAPSSSLHGVVMVDNTAPSSSSSHTLIQWSLPPHVATQTAFNWTISSAAGGAALLHGDSGSPSCSEQHASIALGALAEASLFVITITVRGTARSSAAATTITSAAPFFTPLRSWTAKPIWITPCPSHNDDESSPPRNTSFAWFKASLPIPSASRVVSAIAFVTAEGPLNIAPDGCCGENEQGTKILAAYKLSVNGVKIGVGPGRAKCGAVAAGDCERATPFDGFLLRSSLFAAAARDDDGTLDIVIESYGQQQPSYGVTPRVLFELVLRMSDGTTRRLASGSRGWSAFDAACDASCPLYRTHGNSGGRFGGGYWYFYPHENPDARCLPSHDGWNTTVIETDFFAAPLRAKSTLPIRPRAIALQSLTRLAKGHWIFQLPSEVMGGLALTLRPPSRNERTVTVNVRTQLSEQLSDDGITPRVPMYTGATFTSNWTLVTSVGDEDCTLTQHEYVNWRFGELFLTDAATGATVDLDVGIAGDDAAQLILAAWLVHYDFGSSSSSSRRTTPNATTTTTFTSSSSALNKVWALARNSVEKLGLDFYADSNARQRSYACQADATTASQAQFATSAELAMPRAQMEMIMNFGHVPWPYPPPPPSPAAHANGTGGFTSPTWADWTVLPAINVVNDALFTGDLSLGKKYFTYLTKYHLYRDAEFGGGGGLIVDEACEKDPKKSCLSALIDTSGGSDDNYVQSPCNAVVQAWVYYGKTQVARLARWIGRDDDASTLEREAAALKVQFNTAFIHPTSGAVCDGRCATVNHTSIHASFYALAFGLVDALHAPGAVAYVQHRIAASAVGFPGGSYPIQFALLALFKESGDEGASGVALLTDTRKHSWLAMLALNATTTMECWSADELPNLSFSHIWSASPSFVIPWYVGGVMPLEPGWTRVQIAPKIGALVRVQMTMPTVRGAIHVLVEQRRSGREEGSSKGEGGEATASWSMEVLVPGNTRALLRAPRPLQDCVVLDGRAYRALDRGTAGAVRFGASEAVADVGSGMHTLEWC